MSNLKFQLNLNKHPKDCPNYSLVNATNIRVSDDFSCLQNEESIVGHPTINAYIEEYAYNIVSVIPCNKELVIFVTNSEYPGKASILRYNESNDIIVHMYSDLEYSDGKIIGTFTYNINNELIIAFSEYGGNNDTPLKTINLGVWNGENTTTEESNFSDGKLALSPEVKIPSISSFDYVPGNSYKGWYYYFIRYKINKNDYTRWFPIGFPIFVTNLEFKNIFKYGFNGGTATGTGSQRVIDNNFYLNGISDHFSSKGDVADETVYLDLENIDINYNYFQIGFICVSKTYSKAFRTSDISVFSEYKYIMNISNCIEYSADSLILKNYNYYNVGNIINYKNRLYISNYKESNDPNISRQELDKIRLSLNKALKSFLDAKYKQLDTNIETNVDVTDNVEVDFISANPTLYWSYLELRLQLNESVNINTRIQFLQSYIKSNNDTSIYVSEYTEEQKWRGLSPYTEIVIYFNINSIAYKAIIEEVISNNVHTYTVTNSKYFDKAIYLGNKSSYINTNNSFNIRKKESTLIPGEVYSFYIHFINKYGESTKGYKLENNIKYKYSGSDIDYFPIALKIDGRYYYLLCPLDNNVFINNQVNTDGLIIASSVSYDLSSNTYTFIGNAPRSYTINDAITELNVISFVSNTINDLKWYELYSTELDTNYKSFSYYKNNNNETLFKIPDNYSCWGVTDFECYKYILNFNLNGFQLPDGYIGYYFSYEKFEPINKITGILCKFDTFDQSSIVQDDEFYYKKYNDEPLLNLATAKFYSSKLDILDSIDLDYNCIKIEKNYDILHNDEVTVYTLNTKDILNNTYPINYNKIEYGKYSSDTLSSLFNYISPLNIQLNTANSVINGTLNIGTHLDITLSSNDINIFNDKNYVRASLLKINKNIYTNENKILIKFSDIYYNNITSGTIDKGLNGHMTYQGTIIYNYNRFILSAENVILTEKYRPYYPCPVFEGLDDRWIGENRLPITYIQQLCYSDTFYEAKSFKTEPETLFQNIELATDKENDIIPFAINNIVRPANSIDLFEELQTNQDKLNPKTYLAKNDNRTYLTQFDKRVRRSNVIADESLNNSWRTFPLEGYKDISENKGNITNLIGIGTTLLVHTEHSLFAFDGSNTLKTGDDQNIRLTLPDIFDIDYTEVFTSDLGVCGLQDKEAWVVGQFGYIFYDNDAHRLYKFAFKKIEIIDFDIVQFLNFNVPYKVRFAQDIERNRILVSFEIYETVRTIGNVATPIITKYTLSYNYQLNNFISLHTYSFDKGINTKNILYLQYNNKLYCNKHDLFNTIYNNIQRRAFPIALPESYNVDVTKQYGYFENGNNKPSSISIIVNDSYQLIKTIEFLTYKLFKRDLTSNSAIRPNKIINEFDIANEREYSRTPYSGYKLRVHNDMCDTGLIDVHVDIESNKNIIMNYKKPWWEFGNWNFNYLRDTKFSDSLHDIMSRVYGNYFIIDIIFYDDNNPYNQKIEFENLDVKLIADETV